MPGSSKQLVYLPGLRKNTWLLMSKRSNTVYIREYTGIGVEIIRKLNVRQAEKLLSQPGAYVERIPCYNRIRVDSVDFWTEQIRFRNLELAVPQPGKKHRLQDEFKAQTKPLIEQDKIQELRGVFHAWKRKFDDILDKSQFNHWDNDDASPKYRLDTGLGWTSYLLERSRRNGNIALVSTGDPRTDFALASTEISHMDVPVTSTG